MQLPFLAFSLRLFWVFSFCELLLQIQGRIDACLPGLSLPQIVQRHPSPRAEIGVESRLCNRNDDEHKPAGCRVNDARTPSPWARLNQAGASRYASARQIGRAHV